jgi:soluble lytic murein transglycosylase-like protein
MTKTACLILGSCLVLQAPAWVIHNSGGASELPSEQPQSEEMPLYVEAHSRELTDEAAQPVAPSEVARYIHKTTRELLPVPFRGRSRQIAQALIETANKHQMDPLFLMAVIKQESRFNPEARGSHGEIGLMQIKPSTALAFASLKGLEGDAAYAKVSSDLADPVENIRMGAAYLANLRASFKRHSHLYISAYNMGAKRVRAHVADGVQPRIYSSRVLAQYAELADGMSVRTRAPAHQATRTLDL